MTQNVHFRLRHIEIRSTTVPMARLLMGAVPARQTGTKSKFSLSPTTPTLLVQKDSSRDRSTGRTAGRTVQEDIRKNPLVHVGAQTLRLRERPAFDRHIYNRGSLRDLASGVGLHRADEPSRRRGHKKLLLVHQLHHALGHHQPAVDSIRNFCD